MPSKSRAPGARSSGEPPEIVQQLGRAVLSYSLRKLNEQKASRQQDASVRPRHRSGKSRDRDRSCKSERGSSRGTPRSDSGDMHTLASQLAVGLVAFGIRHLIRRRREARRRAAAAVDNTAKDREVSSSEAPRQRIVDAELLTALDAVTGELQSASESIRRLAYGGPSSHRNCAVREALAADAERLASSLAQTQASINNMRNLHPALGRGTAAQEGREGRRRAEPNRGRERGGIGEITREPASRREPTRRPSTVLRERPDCRGELRGRRRPEVVGR